MVSRAWPGLLHPRVAAGVTGCSTWGLAGCLCFVLGMLRQAAEGLQIFACARLQSCLHLGNQIWYLPPTPQHTRRGTPMLDVLCGTVSAVSWAHVERQPSRSRGGRAQVLLPDVDGKAVHCAFSPSLQFLLLDATDALSPSELRQLDPDFGKGRHAERLQEALGIIVACAPQGAPTAGCPRLEPGS